MQSILNPNTLTSVSFHTNTTHTHTYTRNPIPTRWKRDASGAKKQHEGKPVLEFVAIRRGDTNTWAIPGVSYTTLHPTSSTSSEVINYACTLGGGS